MMKPILFNTDMVKAILEGRKTVTRRVIKQKYNNTHIEWKNDKFGQQIIELQNEEEGVTNIGGVQKVLGFRYIQPPYRKGDILYVRETWQYAYNVDGNDRIIEETGRYFYYADGKMPFTSWIDPDTGEHKDFMPWKPSIHMPKEAARIFLRVTNVSVAKLQDITEEQAKAEGAEANNVLDAVHEFRIIWDDTLKGEKALIEYGWFANPWVWVIEFERVEKPNEWI